MSYNTYSDREIGVKIIKLCIYICYYLRINDQEKRMEFNGLMEKTFKNEFLSEVREEQEYIIENIEIKEGIAKNDALKENLFTLFVCINTEVQVFIFGKPRM